MTKILIISGSGIGNSIMFGPALKALRRKFPSAKIDLYVYKKSFAEPFRDSSLIEDIYYNEGIKSIAKLRKNKYDLSITVCPNPSTIFFISAITDICKSILKNFITSS